jgi:serine/threonine protein kinase
MLSRIKTKTKVNKTNKTNKSIKSNKSNKTHKTNKSKKTKKINHILKGGKYLDEGGFGCVVRPALACRHLSKKLNLNNYVSKIISDPDAIDDTEDEIEISKILRHIDPNNDYYLPIKEYCYLNALPKDRTNVVDVEYKDEKHKKYNLPKHLTIDKHHCDMDLNDKPLNLIILFGGISLSKIMKTDRKDTYNMKARMHQLFITNIKTYVKHLLMGIELMHRYKIVNRDIKQKNIMMYVEPLMVPKLNTLELKTTNPEIKKIMKMRYIDFGLSTYIKSSLTNNIKNIALNGTKRYIPPELFITYYLIKYRNESTKYKTDYIHKQINEHVKKAFLRIEETTMITMLSEKVTQMINKIHYLYNTEPSKLLDKYYGLNNTSKYNGYLQKADVYALGITIFDTLQLKKHSNIDVRENKSETSLYNLLLKMIEPNPDERFNVIECINHPYFKS